MGYRPPGPAPDRHAPQRDAGAGASLGASGGGRAVPRILTALLAKAQNDPEFGEAYRAHFVEPRRDLARAMFSRAIARGEIPADADVEVATDLLWGPLSHRLLHGHAPLNDRFARRVVDTVLAGILPRAKPPELTAGRRAREPTTR